MSPELPTDKKPDSIISTHKVLSALVVAIFTIGVVGVTTTTSLAAESFQASITTLNSTQTKRKVLNYLIKKSAEQKTSADPAVIKCSDVSFDANMYKGEFIARSLEFSAKKNQQVKVSLYLKNTGTTPWLGDSSGCSGKPLMRLGTAKLQDHKSELYTPQDLAWKGANRIAMKESRVEPNGVATFTFVMTAPNTDDILKEYLQPVVEGVKWMTEPVSTQTLLLRVGTMNEDLLKKAFLLGFAGRASSLDTSKEIMVDVNLTSQKTVIKLGDTVLREYLVSTGAYNTPTPPGRFKIMQKQTLRIGAKAPHYRMPHFQLLTPKGVGFHALPYLENDKGLFWAEALNHIGRRVSHGCVRLLPEDAQELFDITQVGTLVVAHY